MKLIFFDTETTGNTPGDFLCQLAYKSGEESFCELYKPPILIPPAASAVHHITNKMVAGKSAFRESAGYAKIKTLFESSDTVAVAHNAVFDMMIFKKEDIVPAHFICTLRVARYLDPDEKIESYRLQFLRYLLEIEIEATAHDALGDVLVLEQLFARLQKKLMEIEKISADQAITRMIEISSTPSLIKSFKFGKHNGKSVADVAKTDAGYLDWLLKQKMENESDEEDWIYTLRHHLGKLPV